MTSRETADREADSDLTPMIDAVFLLIIFFLCIDFRTLEAKVPVALPADSGSQPQSVDQIEILRVLVHCDQVGESQPRYPGREPSDLDGRPLVAPVKLVGHQIHWTVGPKRCGDGEELQRVLDSVVEDPSARVPDPLTPGATRLMPVEVVPLDGTTYGDVALTVDMLTAAGFDDVRFGAAR